MKKKKDPEVLGSDKEIEENHRKDTEKQFLEWLRFYHEILNLEFEDATEIVIPPRQPGFKWLVVVPRHVDLAGVLEACRERFQVETCFRNAGQALGYNARSNARQGYAVWVKHRQITDIALMGMSAEELDDMGIKAITLLERLLMELRWFTEQGTHLDQTRLTLCAGTRFVEDSVPTVAWMRDEQLLRVRWIGYTGSKPFIAAREVVEAGV